MDKLHVSLTILLGISIILLGLGFLKSPADMDVGAEAIKEKSEVWSGTITPDDINNIADHDWIGRLKVIDNTRIAGSEKMCLNICGNRCLWLGYSYKSHTVEPGSFLWGDNENIVCSCECYIRK